MTGDDDEELSAVEELARAIDRERARRPKPTPAPPPPAPRIPWRSRLWRVIQMVIFWAVALFLGWSVLGFLSEDRGPECDTASECDMYEPPEDVGIP